VNDINRDDVHAILASAEVWDMTLPWVKEYQEIDTLARFKRAGFTFVSTTTEDFPPSFEGVRQCI
jgi:membrane dipeptidase